MTDLPAARSDRPVARSVALSHPLVAGMGLCLAAYLAVAAWLIAHPAALPSDDALFFARGLVHFDILDFAPQFPGYPGFIAMGKVLLALTGDPVRALFVLTVTTALALPPVAAWLVWRATGDVAPALAAFALTLAMPLLPDLALSMLSDGTGILFLLVSLALLPRQTAGSAWRAGFWLSGAALGWAACCRPSDLVLLAGAAAMIAWRVPRGVPAFVAGGAIVVLPVLSVVFALDGPLYVWAGLHFVEGHVTEWGNTVFSPTAGRTWVEAIMAQPAGLPIALVCIGGFGAAILRLRFLPPSAAALSGAFAAHTLWVALMQNPDHLRHLAPLVLIGGLLVVVGPPRRVVVPLAGVLLAFDLYGLAVTVDPTPDAPPPLARAALAIEASGKHALALNDGVSLMRERLPDVHVFDMQSPADAMLGVAAVGGGYRLATTPLGPPPLTVYPSRVPGENPAYLYAFDAVSPAYRPRSGTTR